MRLHEPTRFERALLGAQKAIVRAERERCPLLRALELARLDEEDLALDPAARATVRRLLRAAIACEWESLRARLAARVAYETWLRAHR